MRTRRDPKTEEEGTTEKDESHSCHIGWQIPENFAKARHDGEHGVS